MLETRIYESGDGWLRKEEIWHGANESFLISHSQKRSGIFSQVRPWKESTVVIIGNPQKESWLTEELRRAKENGDLNE